MQLSTDGGTPNEAHTVNEEEKVDWLRDAAALALMAGIRLGVPVIVLFVIGYQAFRAEQRRQRLLINGCGGADSEVWGGLTGVGTRRRCWEVKRCPQDVRGSCPAFKSPDLPCWQAIKVVNGGRIKSECIRCVQFLSGPQVVLPKNQLVIRGGMVQKQG